MRKIAAVVLAAVLLVAAACASPGSQPDDSSAGLADKAITPLRALVLGVVEGITEYLPVSSTGHLILASEFLGLNYEDEAVKAFEVVIQIGAILAVVGLYRSRVGQMLRGLIGREQAGLRLFGLLAVAFAPAVVFGLLLEKHIKAGLFKPGPVVAALAIGGVVMVLVDRWRRRGGSGPARPSRGIESMTFRMALLIGLAQCLAMWPGTSRSMVTILAGLLVGLEVQAAAEFSFLLALPTLSAACLHDLLKHHDSLGKAAGPEGLLIGLLVSGLVAAAAVKLFVSFLNRRGLAPFGYYRILVAIAMLGLLLAGRVRF